jgi:ribosomal protein S18 acetylase RimI-like enzyme
VVRLARPSDAVAIGRLLHAFNSEYSDPSPGPAWLAQRMAGLIAADEATVLLAGDGPDGVAVLRFRQALWSEGLECYLAELYVAPARRATGLGRALMLSAIEHARARGAAYMELGTAETDVAARSLYESLGFSNREGKQDGPLNYCYELEL